MASDLCECLSGLAPSGEQLDHVDDAFGLRRWAWHRWHYATVDVHISTNPPRASFVVPRQSARLQWWQTSRMTALIARCIQLCASMRYWGPREELSLQETAIHGEDVRR